MASYPKYSPAGSGSFINKSTTQPLCSSRVPGYHDLFRDLEKVRAELLAENQILKAKLEFAPDIPRPSETKSADKKGVLDSDLF